MLYIYTVGYYSSVKNNNITPFPRELERQLESGRLQDELETQFSGNCRESMRVTLTKTLRNGRQGTFNQSRLQWRSRPRNIFPVSQFITFSFHYYRVKSLRDIKLTFFFCHDTCVSLLCFARPLEVMHPLVSPPLPHFSSLFGLFYFMSLPASCLNVVFMYRQSSSNCRNRYDRCPGFNLQQKILKCSPHIISKVRHSGSGVFIGKKMQFIAFSELKALKIKQ